VPKTKHKLGWLRMSAVCGEVYKWAGSRTLAAALRKIAAPREGSFISSQSPSWCAAISLPFGAFALSRQSERNLNDYTDRICHAAEFAWRNSPPCGAFYPGFQRRL
jgi:hypothetical protein